MNFVRILFPIIALVVCVTSCNTKELPLSDQIRFNQLGFYPLEEKIAVYVGGVRVQKYEIRDLQTNKIVYSSLVSFPKTSAFSNKQTYVFDFSSIDRIGKYRIELPGICKSADFEIRSSMLDDVAIAGVKAFYYQRTATPIEERFAGKWSREVAHLDDNIIVHPSAASKGRPSGTVISSSKGWYDAGDYNKYIVNSGFTVGVLLSLYEDYPDQIKRLDVTIPESSNQTPDLLDEVHWNLDWMLTMQDPSDGGVYHKLTSPQFEGFIKPVDCKKTRYVVAKSVTATLDFAASMAQAARVFKSFDTDYPGFAEKALAASEKAFSWAQANPEKYYKQSELNKQFKPEIKTGEYGDLSAEDEFFWASVELYITTGNEKYLQEVRKYLPNEYRLPVWGKIASLGTLSLIRKQDQLSSPDAQLIVDTLKKQLLVFADKTIKGVEYSPYNAPYGMHTTDFFWGCNSDAASAQGMTFLYAWKLTKHRSYLINALRNMDYILGRNAIGYCYVTGFGNKSPLYPHHRLAASDGVDEPIPGFLVGGSNPGKQDGCAYLSDIADECYIDIEESYASNEIAINWQALFSYFSSALRYNLE